MAVLWNFVRGWFARVGSDPYYASFDRSLGNIKVELDRLQAARVARAKAWAAIRARFWGGFAAVYVAILAFAAYVNRQPHGTYTPGQQAARVAPSLVAPVAAWLAHRMLSWLQGVLDRRSAARMRLLEAKLRKQVSELKDSTRYDRTLALLQKYDPDYAPPKPQPAPGARGKPAGGAINLQPGAAAAPSGLPARAAGAAVNAAGSALQGAGARMFPVMAQLYSRAAGSLIADDPVTLSLLREAQQQSDILQRRLMNAEGQVVALLQANIALKTQLGAPTEDEEAALAAWMGQAAGGGTASSAGTASVGPADGGMPALASAEAAEAGSTEAEAPLDAAVPGADVVEQAAHPAEAAEAGSGSEAESEAAGDGAPASPGAPASRVSRRNRGGRS